VYRNLAVFFILALAHAATWSMSEGAVGYPAFLDDESTIEKDEQDVAAAPGTPRSYGIGIGRSGSTMTVDVPRDDRTDITFGGWGVFGRVGLVERWGLQFAYHTLEDNESFSTGEEFSFDEVTADAYWVWLETEYSQWHLKFGLAWVDARSKTPSTGIVTDQALGPCVGTGVRWGSPRYALFFDFGLTFVDLELTPGVEESLLVGNTIIGFIYNF